MNNPVDLYLLHFNQPYKHAKHYLGVTRCGIENRIKQHENGHDVRLLQVLKENNIGFTVAKVWLQVPRKSETKMKGRGLTEYCPICSKKPREPRL